MTRVAIVGGGLGGAVLAGALAKHHEVALFEKGRGFGGRMATRQTAGYRFDHGAQYFTVEAPRFAALLEPLRAAGVVAEWEGGEALFREGRRLDVTKPRRPRLVGVPGMSNLVQALAGTVDAQFGVDVALLAERQGSLWALSDVEGKPLGSFDLVISTATPRQTIGLFGDRVPVGHPLRAQRMVPCYALMLGWDRPWKEDWVSARIEGGKLGFIGVNSSKPGRDATTTALVVHTTPEMAEVLLDLSPDEIARRVQTALIEEAGIDASDAALSVVHRWKSARMAHEAALGPWFDVEQGLAATGDWAGRSRVEDVALAALDLAASIHSE
jgi:predicted NAD/FAD-dependent oxidoreductase